MTDVLRTTRPTPPRPDPGWSGRLDEMLDRPMSTAVQWLLVAATMAAAMVLRLLRIQSPPLDRTIWKEIDFIAVSTNFHLGGYNIFRPEVTWPAEEPRFTAMEFPLVPWLTAWLYEVDGVVPLAVRMVPLVSWLALIPVVFLLTRHELGVLTALGAAAGVATMPLLNPFGETLLTEPTAVLAAVCAVYGSTRWAGDGRTRFLVLAAVSLGLTVLLKLEAAWIALPMGAALLRRHPRPSRAWVQAVGAAALAMLPVVGWYAWAYHLETTGVHHFSVFVGHDKFQVVAMLGDPMWWATMQDRFLRYTGGVPGALLVLVGALVAIYRWRRALVFLVWGGSGLVYTVLLAEGQLDAPYRQLYQVPVLAVAGALGVVGVITAITAILRPASSLPMPILAVLVVVVPWLGIPGNLVELRPDALRWDAAALVRGATAPGETIVVAGAYDPKVGGNDLSPLIYHYSGRQGWTIEPGGCAVETIEALKARGARLFLELPPVSRTNLETCSEQVREELRARYLVLADSDFFVVDLRAPTEGSEITDG